MKLKVKTSKRKSPKGQANFKVLLSKSLNGHKLWRLCASQAT